MEENQKKTGTRDISDLKARLGMKKTGMQPAVPPPAPPVADPIIASPPPMAPSAPVVADPRRDPFAVAAPSAPAYYDAPLPGVDDGQPAASLSKPQPWGKVIRIALIGVVALGAGFATGRSCDARMTYNLATDDAAKVKTEVEKLAKKLDTISQTIDASAAAQRHNPDPDLAEKLGSLGLKDPETQAIFHTNYYRLTDLAIDRLFNYYNDTLRLYRMVRDHAKRSEGDKEAIVNFMKNVGKTEKNYAVYLDTSSAIALAHFVELGTPVCQEEGKSDCNASQLKGFKYRTDVGGSWFEKPTHGKPTEMIYPLKKEGLLTTVASGSPDLIAARDHLRRQEEIRLIAAKLATDQKALLADLQHAAERPKLITF